MVCQHETCLVQTKINTQKIQRLSWYLDESEDQFALVERVMLIDWRNEKLVISCLVRYNQMHRYRVYWAFVL